jgi:hypothetical protein
MGTKRKNVLNDPLTLESLIAMLQSSFEGNAQRDLPLYVQIFPNSKLYVVDDIECLDKGVVLVIDEKNSSTNVKKEQL